MPDVAAPPRPRRRAIIAGLLALLGLAGVLLAWQGYTAVSALRQANVEARALQTALVEGQAQAAEEALGALQSHTARAQGATDGFGWSVLSRVPFLGDDAAALADISLVSSEIAQYGLPPLIETSGAVQADRFSPRDGRVDVAALTDSAPAIQDAATVFRQTRRIVDEIDETRLIGPLRDQVEGMRDLVRIGDDGMDLAARAARLMPTMLGGEERRNHLLITMNNAEIRSTGGMPGSWSLVTAHRGRMRIVAQGGAAELSVMGTGRPAVQLTREERDLFTTRMHGDFRNVNLTPDFPRAAQIAAAMAERGLDTPVHGVIAIDPVALSYILEGTGPITMSDGVRIDAQNVVAELLHRVYTRFDSNPEQDAYFEEAAERAFDLVTAGGGDAYAVLRGMIRGAAEGRILVWSADREEQDVLRGTPVSGALDVEDSTTPHLGVFLNDGTGAKLQYFLRTEHRVEALECRADDRQRFVWTGVLRSQVPRDQPLSIWVTGLGHEGRPAGSQLVTLRVYAPVGGRIDRLTIDGSVVGAVERSHRGRSVMWVSVWLEPGAEAVVEAIAVSGEEQPRDPVVTTTPGIAPGPHRHTAPSACGD